MKDFYFGFGVVALHSNEICIFYLLMTPANKVPLRPEEPELSLHLASYLVIWWQIAYIFSNEANFYMLNVCFLSVICGR